MCSKVTSLSCQQGLGSWLINTHVAPRQPQHEVLLAHGAQQQAGHHGERVKEGSRGNVRENRSTVRKSENVGGTRRLCGRLVKWGGSLDLVGKNDKERKWKNCGRERGSLQRHGGPDVVVLETCGSARLNFTGSAAHRATVRLCWCSSRKASV